MAGCAPEDRGLVRTDIFNGSTESSDRGFYTRPTRALIVDLALFGRPSSSDLGLTYGDLMDISQRRFCIIHL